MCISIRLKVIMNGQKKKCIMITDERANCKKDVPISQRDIKLINPRNKERSTS